MEYWVVYDVETGADLYAGSGSIGSAAIQPLEAGTAILVVPQSVITRRPIDLAALKAALVVGVDNDAERVRSAFITALPGQVGTYLQKEAAARRWIADNSAPTFMLEPEAVSRRMTIADLAAEVISNAELWGRLSGAIEGLRFAAKARITEATTIGAIVEAAVIDWSVLDASAA